MLVVVGLRWMVYLREDGVDVAGSYCDEGHFEIYYSSDSLIQA